MIDETNFMRGKWRCSACGRLNSLECDDVCPRCMDKTLDDDADKIASLKTARGDEMSALRDVQGWMSFFGWTDGGGPGSVKMDACNVQVASHGDARWQQDVEYACYRAEQAKQNSDLIDELETSLSSTIRTEP